MRILLIVTAALSLAGCQSSLSGANAAGGIVQVGLTTSSAFNTANDHCKKFGKIARISSTSILGDTINFDCVAS